MAEPEPPRPARGAGKLVLVATPIGNIGDLSTRARQALAECDAVACEDTRETGRLLAALGIKRPLLSCFDANESQRSGQIAQRCAAGETIAVVSTRGHPGISDPGHRLVAACVEAGVAVTVVPGPSAAISSVAISGLPPHPFCFHGFLPRRGAERRERLAAMAKGGTHVVFESPARVVATLREFAKALDDPRVAVVRELTKLYEEVVRGRASEVANTLADRDVLGELTIVLHVPEPEAGALDPDLVRRARELCVEHGFSKSDAARAVAHLFGVPRREIYTCLMDDPGDASDI